MFHVKGLAVTISSQSFAYVRVAVVDGIMSRATDAEKLAASLQSQLKEAQQKIASGSTQGQRLQEVESRLEQVDKRYAELQTKEQSMLFFL